MIPTCCAHGDQQEEVDALRRWKAEALALLDEWELVWIAAGRPGALGELKPISVLRWVLARSGSNV